MMSGAAAPEGARLHARGDGGHLRLPGRGMAGKSLEPTGKAGSGDINVQRTKPRIALADCITQGVLVLACRVASHVETGEQRMQPRAGHADDLRCREQRAYAGGPNRLRQCVGKTFCGGVNVRGWRRDLAARRGWPFARWRNHGGAP